MEIIHENLREILIPCKFFQLCKECRESFYYLESMEKIYKYQIVLKEEYGPERIQHLNERITNLKDSYNLLESETITGNCANIEDNITCFDLKKNIDINQLVDLLIKYVELKSKLDKLQVDLIDYVIDFDISLIKKIVESKKDLEPYYINFMKNYLISEAFNHSVDEDKVVTYKITTKNKEIIRYFKNHNKDIPIFFKLRDYTFELNKKREIYKLCRGEFLNFLALGPRVDAERHLRDLTEKQYKLNKHVVILTYLVAAMTFISLLFGGISSYYTIKDHLYNEKEIINENIEKAITDIDQQVKEE